MLSWQLQNFAAGRRSMLKMAAGRQPVPHDIAKCLLSRPRGYRSVGDKLFEGSGQVRLDTYGHSLVQNAILAMLAAPYRRLPLPACLH